MSEFNKLSIGRGPLYEYKLLIPKERVGVLIGDKGQVKRLIESKTNTKLLINDGEVLIKGEDSLNAWLCNKIVKAIGRGFSPRDALKLLQDGFVLEVIDLMGFARNQKDKYRLRSRVIGEGGRVKSYLEGVLKCEISVYGKTISVIGLAENVTLMVRAIELILDGARVNTMKRFIDNSLNSKTESLF